MMLDIFAKLPYELQRYIMQLVHKMFVQEHKLVMQRQVIPELFKKRREIITNFWTTICWWFELNRSNIRLVNENFRIVCKSHSDYCLVLDGIFLYTMHYNVLFTFNVVNTDEREWCIHLH